MNTTVLETLAAQQRTTRRRQRALQHASALVVGVLLVAGAGKAQLFSAPTPAQTVASAALAVERGLTPHGPDLAPSVEKMVGKAAVAKAAPAAPARKLTRVRRAAQFDAAEYADVVGVVFEEGVASFYGAELEGRPTANGEIFEPDGATAAHRTLPLGSVIRVTNLRNGKSVVVRVNDRGPFVGDRILDLSHGAAKEIKMAKRGTTRVRIEVL